ncbi:MAG: hypothetical protein WC675_05010 [Patescibacteria group bacterium]|jgi:hypothetical protein
MTITVGEQQVLDASISPEVVVLYHNGSREPFGIIRIEHPETIQAVDGKTLQHLLRDTNTDWLRLQSVSLRQIRARLGFEKCLRAARGLVETIIDTTGREGEFQQAARLLEDYLHLPNLRERLENILCSPTTPIVVSLDEVIKSIDQDTTPIVHELLVGIEECRSQSGTINLAWGTLPVRIFGSREKRKYLETVLTRLGVFRRLAQGHDLQAICDGLRANNPELAALPIFEQVMRSWQRDLPTGTTATTAQ